MKYYCTAFPPCNESFRKEKALEAHIKTQHEEIKPYPCTFIDPDTSEKCTSSYQTEGALQRHMYKKHPTEKEDGLFCMICAQPGNESELIVSETGDMVEVPTVPLAFATHEDLKTHVAQCHPPVCSECGQHFKSESTLRSHFDTLHADPAHQPRFACPKPDCESVFNRKHNLMIHIQTVHEKRARFSCTPDAQRASKHDDLRNWDGQNACGAAFKAKSSLDQHIRTHHLGLGNRKQLRKAAKSKKKPEASMLSMLTGIGYEKTREVPCVVKTCEYRFYMDRDLRRHLRAAHNMSEDEAEEAITERDALTGGQFWIGGLDDPMGMLDSVEPSMPQTPAPYFVDGGMTFPQNMEGQGKGVDPRFNMFDQQFDGLSLLKEDQEMDLAMGLDDLAPATDIQEGLQWDMGLAPVGQYNIDHE